MLKKSLYVIPLLGVVAALAGAAYALSNGGTNGPNPHLVYFAPQSNASSAPLPAAAALTAVLRRVNSSQIDSATLGSAPAGSTRASMPWLHVRVHVPSLESGQAIRSLWESDLVVGAVADLAGANDDQFENVGGAVVEELLPSGVKAEVLAGVGDVAHDQAFPGDGERPADVRSSIQRALEADGLTLVRASVLTAVGPAPAVIVETSDPAAVARAFGHILDDVFGPAGAPRYEGYYFEVREANGTPVMVSSTAYRTGTGRTWVAPAFKGHTQGVIQIF